MQSGPLNGVRILEVEGLGPGPFAAMLLADHGADVITIQRPGPDAGAEAMRYPIVHRGKRSIILDLKSDEDRTTFLRLVKWADGLIEGFRPGVMERLGIGPEQCHSVNPRLVFGRMTGWGQDGPLSQQAGHDMNYLSVAGALWSAALPDDRPSIPPTLLGDIGGGAMYLVTGMLAGLLAAHRTGKGTVVDAAIFDGAAHMHNLLLSLHGALPEGVPAETNGLVGAHWSRTYRCGDGGYISVQCMEVKFYRFFLERLGLEEDEAFVANQNNSAFWPMLSQRLEVVFAEHPQHHWVDLFEGTDACVTPVLSPAQSHEHEHNAARQTWRDTKHGLQAAAAPRFSTWPTPVPRDAPDRGAHTAEILTELADFEANQKA